MKVIPGLKEEYRNEKRSFRNPQGVGRHSIVASIVLRRFARWNLRTLLLAGEIYPTSGVKLTDYPDDLYWQSAEGKMIWLPELELGKKFGFK